jgi:hypothetical protein
MPDARSCAASSVCEKFVLKRSMLVYRRRSSVCMKYVSIKDV